MKKTNKKNKKFNYKKILIIVILSIFVIGICILFYAKHMRKRSYEIQIPVEKDGTVLVECSMHAGDKEYCEIKESLFGHRNKYGYIYFYYTYKLDETKIAQKDKLIVVNDPDEVKSFGLIVINIAIAISILWLIINNIIWLIKHGNKHIIKSLIIMSLVSLSLLFCVNLNVDNNDYSLLYYIIGYILFMSFYLLLIKRKK